MSTSITFKNIPSQYKNPENVQIIFLPESETITFNGGFSTELTQYGQLPANLVGAAIIPNTIFGINIKLLSYSNWATLKINNGVIESYSNPSNTGFHLICENLMCTITQLP